MISFEDLELREAKDSFVGIKKEDDKYVFYLPLGFKDFIEDKPSKEEIKSLFFQFFKLIRKETNKTKPRDGNENKKGVGGEEKDHPIFYDNLNIGELIKTYDDEKIQIIRSAFSKSDEIDLSNIDYDEVYYTKKNELIVTESIKPANQLTYLTADIVRMYAFIYEDIHNQLNEEIFNEIKFLSNEFKEKFNIKNSIFDNISIIEKLKNILEEIDNNVTVKMPEYFDFYEKIYKFLYYSPNEEGIVIGIDNFHSIWEKLCLNYVFKYWKDDILYADYEKEANWPKESSNKRMYCKNPDEEYPFTIYYGDEKKCIYPDLIINPIIPINIYYGYFWDSEKISDFFKKHPDSLLLVRDDNFNDYGYKSLFSLYINEEKKIGLKIINDSQWDTHDILKKYENNKIDFGFIKDKILSRVRIYNANIKKTYEELIDNLRYSYLFVLNQLQDFYYLKKFDPVKLEKFEKKESYKDSFKRIGTSYNAFSYDKYPYDLLLLSIIIDFKYKTKEQLTKKDKIKNKFYELCLTNVGENIIVLPKYIKNMTKLEIRDIDSYKEKEGEFPIVYWNMKILLEEYIND